MGYRLALLALSAALSGALLSACGKEIGDACSLSTDCSPNGDRICDTVSSPDGYCTIRGCDYSTCPDEAVCVRFFTGSFADPTGKTCGADVPADQRVTCSLDELCSVSGHCVPRSSEIRYCMRSCSSNGDCRDGYECRDLAKMKEHGGEPVLAPGVAVDQNAPKFCAVAPTG